MMRTIGASALAFGVVLMFNGAASAGDDTPDKAWTTMTLGGQGTVADAAAEDVEYTGYYGGYRGGYGGYRGGYGGYRGGFYGGYRGGYYGGYRGGYYGGGYRGYYGGFRGYPSYAGYRGFGGYGYGWGLGWARPWNYGGFYRPFYSVGYPVYGGYGYCGISGSTEDADAPVVTLNMAVANNPFTPRERQPGMAAPATPAETSLPVSLTKPTSPYTYKAYGEK